MTTGWRGPAAAIRYAPQTDRSCPGRRHVRLIISALTLGMLLAALDQTIVATALPTGITALASEPRISTIRISR
jgi:hypothetical protein